MHQVLTICRSHADLLGHAQLVTMFEGWGGEGGSGQVGGGGGSGCVVGEGEGDRGNGGGEVNVGDSGNGGADGLVDVARKETLRSYLADRLSFHKGDTELTLAYLRAYSPTDRALHNSHSLLTVPPWRTYPRHDA